MIFKTTILAGFLTVALLSFNLSHFYTAVDGQGLKQKLEKNGFLANTELEDNSKIKGDNNV